jgi:hypothetical protein
LSRDSLAALARNQGIDLVDTEINGQRDCGGPSRFLLTCKLEHQIVGWMTGKVGKARRPAASHKHGSQCQPEALSSDGLLSRRLHHPHRATCGRHPNAAYLNRFSGNSLISAVQSVGMHDDAHDLGMLNRVVSRAPQAASALWRASGSA